MIASKFIEADLYRPTDEGRSLHNEASSFYTEVMGLMTPLTLERLPEVSNVAKYLSGLPKTANRYLQLLADLKVSKEKEVCINSSPKRILYRMQYRAPQVSSLRFSSFPVVVQQVGIGCYHRNNMRCDRVCL